MGVACGDLDGDGRPDLAVTNFYDESTTLLPEPRAAASSPTRRAASAWPAPSRYLLGFGIAFLDVNNDGRLDLATANGHVNDFRPDDPLRDARAAPRSAAPGGRLVDVTDARRPALAGPAARPRAWPRATSTTTAGSTC